jgi:N-acetylneuraminic acid mutarotase
MAQHALPPGAVRRRTAFGLLDADGWTWASVKATFWFLLVIFLLGYVPDRAYYITVSPTVDLGYNVISPVNLCPAENKPGLPCPAPAGAVIPWEESPGELALPEGRTGALPFTSGSTYYLVGGETASGATASVLYTEASEDGNLAAWAEGPPLPDARSQATLISLGGAPYVIGGLDGSGAPTTTVYAGTVEEGVLTGWEEAADLALATGLSDASGVSSASGLYLFGGRTAEGISNKTWFAELPEGANAKLEAWVELTELPLPEARASATAVNTGTSVYVLGGEGADGVTNSVFYLGLDNDGKPVVVEATERLQGWGVSVAQSASAALPEPRAGHTSFVNSGAIYVIGGRDGSGVVTDTNYWTVPNSTDGTISGWTHFDVTDIPQPRERGAAAPIGQFVFLTGGSDGTAPLTSSLRADLAPQPPFFRLGLFGITIPALSIKGEIGQQLGYLIAGSAALGNFVLLVVIGWMYSHKPETYRFFRFMTRGRFRIPPEDDYSP